MSDIDIYDDTENLISSDNSTEDEEDELMNITISSHNVSTIEVNDDDLSLSPYDNTIREKCVKTVKPKIIKRKRIDLSYKKRSIKWLNNKHKSKYKQLLTNLFKNNKTKLNHLLLFKNKINSNQTITEATIIDNSNDDDIVINSSELQNNVVDKSSNKDETLKEASLSHNGCKNENAVSNISQLNKQKLDNDTTSKQSNEENDMTTKLYKNIIDRFPKYDAMVVNHIKTMNSSSVLLEENMARLEVEIGTLDNLIKTKENEWNRIIHLKKVKEEILKRLTRKKHILQLENKEKFSLSELEELEMYLTKNSLTPKSSLPFVQQLLVNRADMKKSDLDKERHSTELMHSILFSDNEIGKSVSYDKVLPKEKKHMSTPRPSTPPSSTVERDQSYEYLVNRMGSYVTRERHKITKGMHPDCHYKNSEIYPRFEKCLDINESRSNTNLNNMSTYEIRQNDLYLNNTSYGSIHLKVGEDNFTVNDAVICQECKTHEARFVCAGCGNQWYCSRSCQISAWDQHSETC